MRLLIANMDSMYSVDIFLKRKHRMQNRQPKSENKLFLHFYYNYYFSLHLQQQL